MKEIVNKLKKFVSLNKEKTFGIIRHILTAVGGVIIAKGYVSQSTTQEVIGFVLSLLGFIWSINNKKD